MINTIKWYIWIFIFYPVMFITINALINSVYVPKLTLGEIISIVLTLLGTIGYSMVLFRRWHIKSYPFKIEIFIDKDLNNIKPNESSKIKIIEGMNSLFPKFTLRIRPRKGIYLEEINIRFVKKQLWKWVDVPKKVIHITALSAPQIDSISHHTGRFFKSWDDERGGMCGYYIPPLRCPKGSPLFFEIGIEMRKENELQGYIGFQHKSGDNERNYAHQKIIIKNNELF